jgi:hypothetical protein
MRNNIAVDVCTALPHSPLRRVVGVDDAEAFTITLRPLKIVEQTPDEVAAQINAKGQRTPTCFDVRL